MHKLTIKLKQHTPIIHFQHNQVGATLRATEVKPKLDRFLIESHFGGTLNFDAYNKYLTGNQFELSKAWNTKKTEKEKLAWLAEQKLALNYQLSFTAIEVQISDINKLPGYFGNMGGDNKTLKKNSFATGLQMHFNTRKTKILELIKENINTFLMHHNFGTRQSRGFGSFTVSKDDKHFRPTFLDYQFKVDKNGTGQFEQWKNLFHHIDLFSRSLRAGLNLKGAGARTTFYFKSLAFVYAKSKGIQWDKKTIKENFFTQDLRQQQTAHNEADNVSYDGKKMLVKDLFGLSTVEKWKSYNNASINKKNDEVQRFQSPILFKPVFNDNANFTVHFKAATIPDKMLNQTFNVHTRGKRPFLIKTPEAFDFDDFFRFININFNISEHVDIDFHGVPEYDILDNIYSQLKEQ